MLSKLKRYPAVLAAMLTIFYFALVFIIGGLVLGLIIFLEYYLGFDYGSFVVVGALGVLMVYLVYKQVKEDL